MIRNKVRQCITRPVRNQICVAAFPTSRSAGSRLSPASISSIPRPSDVRPRDPGFMEIMGIGSVKRGKLLAQIKNTERIAALKKRFEQKLREKLEAGPFWPKRPIIHNVIGNHGWAAHRQTKIKKLPLRYLRDQKCRMRMQRIGTSRMMKGGS